VFLLKKQLALLIVSETVDLIHLPRSSYETLRLIVATLTLLLVPHRCLRPSGSANAGTEKEVRDALEKYRTALTQHDATALKQIWADDYTFINGAGEILTKAQRLANLDSRATSFDTITLGGDIKVRVYGNDAAISTSRVTIKGKYSGKSVNGDFQSMTVWVKTSGGWQLVANQVTPITGKD
jgi:ketosteroid isomerase-like protein